MPVVIPCLVQAELKHSLVVFSPYNDLQLYIKGHAALMPLADAAW